MTPLTQAAVSNYSHAAYGDESGTHSDLYQGIGLVSGSEKNLESLRGELARCLGDTSHVEWKELTGHAPKTKAACAFVERSLHNAAANRIRIDVLTWDLTDARHAVPGRDDTANLARHYWRLFVTVGRRWGNVSWGLFPDEGSGVNWKTLKYFVSQTAVQRRHDSDLLTLFEEHRSRFNLKHIHETNSEQCTLTQLADLFVGMACFSREHSGETQQWIADMREKQSGQGNLFADVAPETNHSNPKKAKFAVIKRLKDCAAPLKLGINLSTKGYLWTPKPSNPVNFWPYEPQHELDKAPVRNRW